MQWPGFEGIGGGVIAPGIGRWVAVGCAALDGLESRALEDGPPAIVLTVFFHERSAGEIAERIPGTALWVEHDGIPKVESPVTNPFRAGDPLPGGLVALVTARADEVVLWDPASRSLIVGDVLLGRGPEGIQLCPDSWLPDGVGGSDLARSLHPILELPVERILPGHGEPLLEEAHERLKLLIERTG